jgi:hypothetical protein
MFCARLGLALLGLAAVLSAADPFVGSWNLNAGKSKAKVGQLPKEQTVTIVAAGDDLDVTIKGTSAEGMAISSHYTVPAAGGQGKVIEAAFDAVSGKRLGANRRVISYSKGGKVALTVQSRVSGDGKTMTVTLKGTDAADKPVDAVAVFERQQ